ncbi:transposase [Acidobacteria bacterium AH-259-O06]|nr:transposase [Acidobacteria bacterium AH-259-O06]
MVSIRKTPAIPDEERTPLVVDLLEIIQLLQEQVQALRDEIARLKGEKPKPKIKPSKLEEGSGRKEKERNKGKRPGSAKRSKTAKLKIHETVVVKAKNVPQESRFKGYEDYTVQGLIFRSHNVRYRRERWQTPQGDCIVAPLPEHVEILGGHFSHSLICFVLYQYYHAHVTQPLILEQLWELGIDISAGQINRIITEDNDRFHSEKEEILRAGLEVSSYVNVDDTSARHQGKNGYCTHIGNELFAWFESTESKSRINFLKLLRAGHTDYVLNDDATEYLRAHKLPNFQFEKLVAHDKKTLSNETQWAATLEGLDITDERHVRMATEGALLGSVLEHGVDPALVIMSDDAGQFNVLLHVLCWIHAERTINKLVGYNDKQREAVAEIRAQLWDFYDDLKAYKKAPGQQKKAELEARFDDLFTTKTCYVSLNLALERIHQNKAELLLVLDHPQIPLHNNLSERDIREYVKRRKISGSTRSDDGRRCRDTFTSLKKTCRKLEISFWDYLKHRVVGLERIPPLGEVIRQQARASPGRLAHEHARGS